MEEYKFKAREIVIKMQFQKEPLTFEQAKKCALITVDEIIDIAYWEYMESMGKKEKEYWQEIKKEIINL